MPPRGTPHVAGSRVGILSPHASWTDGRTDGRREGHSNPTHATFAETLPPSYGYGYGHPHELHSCFPSAPPRPALPLPGRPSSNTHMWLWGGGEKGARYDGPFYPFFCFCGNNQTQGSWESSVAPLMKGLRALCQWGLMLSMLLLLLPGLIRLGVHSSNQSAPWWGAVFILFPPLFGCSRILFVTWRSYM